MQDIVQKRIQILQEKLVEKELDAALIYDRENLIYFAGVEDLEGGSLIVPAKGEPKLICLWLDAKHMRKTSGLEVVPYFFPGENVSSKTAELLKELGIENPRVGFTRYFISLKDFQCLRDDVAGIFFGDIAELCYKIRSVKDENEIEKIKKASEFVVEGMKAAMAAVKSGMTETQVLAEAEYAMRKAGSEGSSFRMQVLTKERQQLVHPYAGDYVIQDNEPVVIHLGASYKGYTSKMCRTVFLGEVEEESRKIYDILNEAREKVIDFIKPGVTAGEVYDVAYQIIHDNGYAKAFLDTIGYGVGIRQSEFYPILSKHSKQVIKENMVVDVLLPTIYKPFVGGPRVTDTILVTAEGGVSLTKLD